MRFEYDEAERGKHPFWIDKLVPIQIATFDVDQKTLDGIDSGTIIYTVIQQPFAQGFISVEQLYLYNAFGVLPPVSTPTGPTLVDKSNLDIVKKQLAATGGS